MSGDNMFLTASLTINRFFPFWKLFANSEVLPVKSKRSSWGDKTRALRLLVLLQLGLREFDKQKNTTTHKSGVGNQGFQKCSKLFIKSQNFARHLYQKPHFDYSICWRIPFVQPCPFCGRTCTSPLAHHSSKPSDPPISVASKSPSEKKRLDAWQNQCFGI